MSEATIPAQGPVDVNVRARFWMTRESEWRLARGGNSKGAVPVHGKQSATAVVPLYDQAALDAAVAASREACAKVCDEAAFTAALAKAACHEDGAPAYNHDALDCAISALEQCAADMRSNAEVTGAPHHETNKE